MFCPFMLPKMPKIKILKKWKNSQRFIILHMCTKITIIWSMVPKVQSETDRIFWHFGLSFTPLTPQKSTFWKFKRNTWILHILQMCTINDNHMMYGSWDMEHNRPNFLTFWTIFCPFPLLTTWKIKSWRKKMKKKCLEIFPETWLSWLLANC